MFNHDLEWTTVILQVHSLCASENSNINLCLITKIQDWAERSKSKVQPILQAFEY